MKQVIRIVRQALYNSIRFLSTVMLIAAVFVLSIYSSLYSYAAPEDMKAPSDNKPGTTFFGDTEENTDLSAFGSERRSFNRVVKVGYYIINGFQMYEEPSYYSGYGYDYLQKIRTYTGWDYDYIGDDEDYTFSELYSMTVDGEIDLLGGITWTEERAKKLLFCNAPIDMEYTTIFIKSGDNSYSGGDYSRWDGIRLGFCKGTVYIDKTREFAEDNFFDYKAKYYDSDAELVDALDRGDIDAFVSGSSHIFDGVSILAQFNPSYLFFATGLQNQDLMNSLNHALSQIETVDSGFKEAIMTKYYQGNGTSNISFTAIESLYLHNLIMNDREFVLLANPDNCPLSYLDNKGEPVGILVDMAKAIFESIGLSYKFYPVSNRVEYINALNEGRADVIIDFVSDFSKSEQSGYYECDSYFYTSLSMVHQVGEQDNKIVIKRNGDGIFDDTTLMDMSGSIEVVTLKSIDETMDYLVKHPYTCTYLPLETAGVMVYLEETNSLEADNASLRNVYYCFAMNSDRGNFMVGIFNKACNSFSVQKSAEIISKYSRDNYRIYSFRAFIYDNPMYGFIVIAGLLIIFFLVIIIYSGKRHRLNIEKLNAQLSESLIREKKASEAKKRFFDNMSHDMRTPLNGILGLTRSVLKNGVNTSDNLDYLYKIEDSASYLELLINDSLFMSNHGKIEFELNPKQVDPGQAYDSLRNVAQTYAEERNIRFIVRRKEIVNLPTFVDYNRLEQAVLNVISNAVKFSYINGIVEIDLVSKMIGDDKVEYTLTVQDHGIGMSKEFQATMFEAYTQEDRGEMTDHAGTGIGLAVVKSIVEKMDGTIEVKSQENIGTIVKMTFVFEINTNSIIEELSEPVDEKRTIAGKNILCCEDNELNMDIVCAILESEKVNVERAWNGQEGLDIFVKKPAGTFDAILMDLRMPVMDGFTASRKIRNSGKEDADKIPIIAVTANFYDDNKQASKEAGMDSILSKPVDPKILIGELKRYICK